MDKWGVQDQMYFWRDISTAPHDERIMGSNGIFSFEMYYVDKRWYSIGERVFPKWWMPLPRPPGGGLNDDWEDDEA